MVREKHQVTKDIINVTKDFAETQEVRQRYTHITDDNSRAYTALSKYKGKYKKLIEDFPTLANDYNNNEKIKQQYRKYYNTALEHFEKLALASNIHHSYQQHRLLLAEGQHVLHKLLLLLLQYHLYLLLHLQPR